MSDLKTVNDVLVTGYGAGRCGVMLWQDGDGAWKPIYVE